MSRVHVAIGIAAGEFRISFKRDGSDAITDVSMNLDEAAGLLADIERDITETRALGEASFFYEFIDPDDETQRVHLEFDQTEWTRFTGLMIQVLRQNGIPEHPRPRIEVGADTFKTEANA